MFRSRAMSYCFGFGIILVILSIPVMMGLARPLFDMDNPYTLIYGLVTLPVILLFQGFLSDLASAIWDSPSIAQLDLLSAIATIVFWSLMGIVLGKFNDYKYGGKS